MLLRQSAFYREKGQGIVEYAVLLAFVVAIAAFLFNNSGIKDEVTGPFVSTASILRN